MRCCEVLASIKNERFFLKEKKITTLNSIKGCSFHPIFFSLYLEVNSESVREDGNHFPQRFSPLITPDEPFDVFAPY